MMHHAGAVIVMGREGTCGTMILYCRPWATFNLRTAPPSEPQSSFFSDSTIQLFTQN
jgi:hypothetical protein